jgi:hypothetical protein
MGRIGVPDVEIQVPQGRFKIAELLTRPRRTVKPVLVPRPANEQPPKYIPQHLIRKPALISNAPKLEDKKSIEDKPYKAVENIETQKK